MSQRSQSRQLSSCEIRWRYKDRKKPVWWALCLYLLNVTSPPNKPSKRRLVNVSLWEGSISQMVGAWMFCCLWISFLRRTRWWIISGSAGESGGGGLTGQEEVYVCVSSRCIETLLYTDPPLDKKKKEHRSHLNKIFSQRHTWKDFCCC